MHHMFSAELKCRLCIYVQDYVFSYMKTLCFVVHYVQDYVFSYMKTGDDSNTWLYDGR